MTLVRWDPVSELAGMEINRLDRMFSDLYHETPGRAWVPPVDIFESDDHEVVIKTELPEVRREDISITLENDVLTVQGSRKRENEIKRERFHRMERQHGTFTRAFTLPPTVDASRISATYRDGVLTIRLPQREEAKPKQIAVQAE
jgi:HSP20 family protein